MIVKHQDDTRAERARAIAAAKAHMTTDEEQAFDRLLAGFPGAVVETFIPSEDRR